jgi:hypothetical protein
MEPGECQMDVGMGFRFHGCEVKTIRNRDGKMKRLRQSAADLAASK